MTFENAVIADLFPRRHRVVPSSGIFVIQEANAGFMSKPHPPRATVAAGYMPEITKTRTEKPENQAIQRIRMNTLLKRRVAK
jgi:hypothetical protein